MHHIRCIEATYAKDRKRATSLCSHLHLEDAVLPNNCVIVQITVYMKRGEAKHHEM